MNNNRKGFTLIEMLVVIAVVGILSAGVLTALGPSRNKAKDARIVSAVQQVRALAESMYDGDYDLLGSSGVVQSGTTPLGRLAADVAGVGGQLNMNNGSSPSQAYSVYSRLASSANQFYCVDSTGASYNGVTQPSGPACP